MKSSIELTTRTIIILILMIVLAAAIIMLMTGQAAKIKEYFLKISSVSLVGE